MTLIRYAGYEPGSRQPRGKAKAKTPSTGKRGFAAMSPEQHRALSAKGGKALKPEQRTFSTHEGLAASAGRKGGANIPADLRTYARDPVLARAASLKRNAMKREQGA